MGIFNFFSRDDEDDEVLEASAPQPFQQPENAPTGELFAGMRLDVMT